jgi:hypothetical protein
LPPEVTDDRVLNDLDIQTYNALFGDSDLALIDDRGDCFAVGEVNH